MLNGGEHGATIPVLKLAKSKNGDLLKEMKGKAISFRVKKTPSLNH
jgi:hypothetical protein